MRANRYIALLTLLISSMPSLHAQSPVFSQYYASSLYLNPALSGLEKDIYFGMNYRSQWSNLGLPFNTFQFSFIKPLVKPGIHVKHLGGLGASFLNDVAGPNKEFTTQSVAISGAYNFHLTRYGNNILSIGLQAGAMQQRINYDKLEWSTQYSPGVGFDGNLAGESGFNSQVFSPVLNAGLMWFYTTRGRLSFRTTSVFNGISVSNLIKPNSFVNDGTSIPVILYKVHGGMATVWNRKYEISPNYLIQYQNQNFQVNLGTYIGYYIHPPHLHNSKSTKVVVGAWYRLKDAFILSTGFSNRSWNLGFSYDSNISSLGRSFGYANAYEVSLAYKIVVNKGFKRFSSPLI
jgi:type IX secretion system PorP/SprF family membrane protein